MSNRSCPSRLFSVTAAFCALASVALAGSPPPSLLEQAFPGAAPTDLPGGRTKDFVPIAISSARTWGNPNAIEVVFTAPVDPVTGTNAGFYTVSPGVTVQKADLGADAYTVRLTTTPLVEATLHTLTVNNVQDRSVPPNTIAPNSTAPILKAQGWITRKFYSGIGGSGLSSLTNAAKFPNNPDAIEFRNLFEAPSNIGDNYGTLMAGYVYPPVTGDYQFFIASDDDSILYLSTDDQPANKVRIAYLTAAVASRQWAAVTNQQSAHVTLQAGRRYYIEADHGEINNSDWLAVTWRLRGMLVPADSSAPLPGAFLSSLVPSAAVSLTTPPQNLTVTERAAATFAVTAAGTPAYSYQWRRNGFAIPGATGTNYTLATTTLADNGAQFSVTVSNAFSSVTSGGATLTVLAETNPPTLARLAGGPTMDRVVLAFSEPVMAATANNAANYRLSGGLNVLAARLQPDQTNVVLTTSLQPEGVPCSLTVTGVTDVASLHNAANTTSNFTTWVFSRGYVRREVYQGIPGSAVADLLGSADFPDLPDVGDYLTGTEAPQNIGGNVGERLVGWLMPTITGYYTLFLCTADQGALYLSPDDKPANKVQVATEPQWNFNRNWVGTDRRNATSPENRTAPIFLEAGKRYYFEAVMKDSDGENRVAFTWQRPGAVLPVNGDPPVLAPFVGSYANPAGAALAITAQPTNATVAEATATNFAVAVNASYSPVFYQWQKNGVDIADATNATYTTPRLLRADQGAQFRCYIGIPGFATNSQVATLTVIPDNTPPQAISAATLAGSTNLGLCFNEILDAASATNPANYTLLLGGAVTSARLRPDGQSVALGVTALGYTNYTILLNNIRDVAGNAIAANTPLPVAVVPLTASDIGIAGDPLEPGSTFVCSSNAFDVIAGGSDIWNTHDGFHYVYDERQGDFDLRTRLARLDLKSTYTFAGLVVRENLSAGSRNLRIHLFNTNGANGYHASTRTTQDGGTAQTMNVCCGPVPYPNAWLRLTRTNDTFTGWRGTNGTDWTPLVTMTMSFTGRVFAGQAACPVNNGAGQATTAWFRDYSAAPPAIPPAPIDLLVKKASDGAGALKLDNVYQAVPDNAQTVSQVVNITNAGAWTILVQNDGTTNRDVLLRAQETATVDWTSVYRLGASDITAAMLSASGYVISNLPAGQSAAITVEITPAFSAAGAAARSVVVHVYDLTNPSAVRDSVRLVAINEVSYQPDLQVRRLLDVNYSGVGILNLTGVNQTRTTILEAGETAVFPIQLANVGNVTNSFRITAPGGDPGWNVRYFDALVGGSEITGEMTNTGTLAYMSPGATWEFRAEVSAAGAPPGASNSVLITARSEVNASRADAVRVVAVLDTVTNVPQAGYFTTDADFDRGVSVGLDIAGNQLQIGGKSRTWPYIWVPNSNEGTVSKVDTRTGQELARYRTCPSSVASYANPSRTTIDQSGNCWVGNRQIGTVVKIGLLEAGWYIDRNGNGIPDTSYDADGDGNITGSEILPWGQDECVLYEVVLIPGKEGTFTPGNYSGGYANDYWNPGPRGLAVDFYGNLWAGCWSTMKYYYVDGTSAQIQRTNDLSALDHHPYGAVIDAYGMLWSSGYHETVSRDSLVRMNPADGSTTKFTFGHFTYGLGLDRSNHIFVAGWQSSKLSRVNVATLATEWTVAAPNESRGVVVTDDGEVWVANSAPGTVTRFANDGTQLATIPVGSTPTGVSLDSEGKVWVVNNGDEYIKRINTKFGAVDLSKRIIGGTHYGYSDMTGIIARSATVRFGTWTAIHNSKVEFTPWGTLNWNAYLPTSNSTLTVRVRTSPDKRTWSNWEWATNGVALATTPPGKYLQVEVALRAIGAGENPALYDLTVTPLPQRTADLAITQSVVPTPATNKTRVTWTITATNRGPQDARGVWLTNALPPGVTLVSLSNSLGSVAQTTPFVRVNLGNLAAGSNCVLTVVGNLHAIGIVTNVVAIAHYEQEPTPADNVSALNLLALATPCIPAPAGVSAWWAGEDSVGDVVGTNSAVNVGGISFTNGRVGSGFQFNGTSYLRVPASPATQVGASPYGFTVELWVKPDDVSGSHTLVEWYGNGSPWAVHFWISGWNAGAGNLGAAIPESNGTYHSLVSAPGKLVAGVWQHVALTYDRTTGQATVYLNATNIATANFGRYAANTLTDFQLGARPSETCCYFRGVMDEVSLYTRALSAAELQSVYSAGAFGKCDAAAVPVLRIEAVAGTSLVLSWTAAAPAYQLYYGTTASGPWLPVGTAPQTVGDRLVLPVQASDAARFYRLIW